MWSTRLVRLASSRSARAGLPSSSTALSYSGPKRCCSSALRTRARLRDAMVAAITIATATSATAPHKMVVSESVMGIYLHAVDSTTLSLRLEERKKQRMFQIGGPSEVSATALMGSMGLPARSGLAHGSIAASTIVSLRHITPERLMSFLIPSSLAPLLRKRG